MGAIRLFLALSVTVGHLAGLYFQDGTNWRERLLILHGSYAVILFFIVSGFLMSYVLEKKYTPNAAGTVGFYKARFLRIYPLWWVMLAFVIIFLERNWLTMPPVDIAATVSLIGPELRTSFANYPHGWGTIPGSLGVGWSLGVEVLFYLIAPLLLRSARVAIVAFVLLIVSRLIVSSYYPYGDEWRALVYLFFPHLLPFFLMGHFARLIWSGMRLPGIVANVVGLVALFAAARIVAHWPGPWDALPFYAMTVCFALSLPPIFESTKDIRWMNFCGDLTYPLYLVHRPLMDIANATAIGGASIGDHYIRYVNSLPGGETTQFVVAVAIFLPVALIVSYAANQLIETPLRRVLEALFGAFHQFSSKIYKTLRVSPSAPGNRTAPLSWTPQLVTEPLSSQV
jgi:peptidoglycan/LPS O-acetylase OafA/YrhL